MSSEKKVFITQVEIFRSLEESAQRKYEEIAAQLDDQDMRAVFLELAEAEKGHAAACQKILDILEKK